VCGKARSGFTPGETRGFTLLEVLIVVGIMGLIAAMVWPMRGILDDAQRERMTIKTMDSIVEAMLGHAQLKDPHDLRRVIGGYVGHLGKWPELYEPAGTGLGGLRGAFVGDRFQWSRPFQKVPDTTRESLGQPRGLWTRHLSDQGAPEITSPDWKGPYLAPPVTRNPALGGHFAKNQAEYAALSPTDRTSFHLLQGGEQLTDGWDRAFRFFIIGVAPDQTLCIVSLGPRGQGYADGFVQDCNPNSPQNQGKILRVLHQRDWLAVREAQAWRSSSPQQLIFITQDQTERIVRALIGTSPSGPNTGYSGDLLAWPRLFQWVCTGTPPVCAWTDTWQDPNFPGTSRPFNQGSPRDLWTQGALPSSRLGIGWRHAYLAPPEGKGANEQLLDAWNRPYHFFRVWETIAGQNQEQLMILSGGQGGTFAFSVRAGGEFHLADYDPNHAANQDNLVRIVRRSEWLPGFLRINQLIIEGVTNCAQTRCSLCGVLNAQGARADLVLQCGVDGTWDGGTQTWTIGGGGNPAFSFGDLTPGQLVTGGRYLVCWVDANANNFSDPGESGGWRIFPSHGHPAGQIQELVRLRAAEFQPLP
jgi:prepilin-type N-terminal cleavage/methylation domain-containing protein